MAGEWPGFRTDGTNPWRGRPASDKPRADEVTQAPTLPKSVRDVGKNHKINAKQALLAVAERIANGELPEADRKVGPYGLHFRANLASGATRSTPNHHLVGQALRMIPDGRNTFLGCVLRASRNGDPDAKAWWTAFSTLQPSQQLHVDFDDVCEVVGVPPDRIMAIVVSTQMRMGSDVADFVAATFHPHIVRQTAKSALRIGGEHATVAQRDRELMLQHGKFIAGPKGVNVNVSAQANAAAAAQAQPSVPTFAESVIGAQQTQVTLQRALEQGRIVEAEVAE